MGRRRRPRSCMHRSAALDGAHSLARLLLRLLAGRAAFLKFCRAVMAARCRQTTPTGDGKRRPTTTTATGRPAAVTTTNRSRRRRGDGDRWRSFALVVARPVAVSARCTSSSVALSADAARRRASGRRHSKRLKNASVGVELAHAFNVSDSAAASPTFWPVVVETTRRAARARSAVVARSDGDGQTTDGSGRRRHGRPAGDSMGWTRVCPSVVVVARCSLSVS